MTYCCVHVCRCVSIGRGLAILLLVIKAVLKGKWMVLSCEEVRQGDFGLRFIQKKSVCVVSVNGKVSGKREIGHTCNHLIDIAQNETVENNFISYVDLKLPWSSFILCTEYVLQGIKLNICRQWIF